MTLPEQGTDINQASEELRKSVEQCFIKNNMCDCGGEHNALNIDETEYFDVESVVNDVISLIRTEKLKLLAEVRERVVGDKEYYHEHYPFVRTNEQHIEVKEKIARDDLRAEQRELLTKLEAEL